MSITLVACRHQVAMLKAIGAEHVVDTSAETYQKDLASSPPC